MAPLEAPDRETGSVPADTTSSDGTALSVSTARGSASLTVPDQATASEAAALAAAIAGHLRAERAADESDEPVPEADPWTLAGRLGARSRSDLPRSCACGEEWKMAARSY